MATHVIRKLKSHKLPANLHRLFWDCAFSRSLLRLNKPRKHTRWQGRKSTEAFNSTRSTNCLEQQLDLETTPLIGRVLGRRLIAHTCGVESARGDGRSLELCPPLNGRTWVLLMSLRRHRYSSYETSPTQRFNVRITLFVSARGRVGLLPAAPLADAVRTIRSLRSCFPVLRTGRPM